MDLTHASFFSGVGGLDLGLERAGWRTVSFSEIDPYASAVLAERWPGVPNLGDIVRLEPSDAVSDGCGTGSDTRSKPRPMGRAESTNDSWHTATLWTGGFPCQDLSVAGKRRGFGSVAYRGRRGQSAVGEGMGESGSGAGAGHGASGPNSTADPADDPTRSGLAFAFLDLVERHRPPAILLENVPGLLSSNGGKDFGALLGRLGQLGYWWAYRILDAQFFGVPQRRRRVFVCALHAGAGFGADSAAAVLSVGSRCDGHSATGDEARTGVAERTEPSVTAPQLLARDAKGPGHNGADERIIVSPALSTAQRLDQPDLQQYVVRSSPDSGGVREADGLAGRPHDREVVGTLRVGPQRPQDGGPGDTVPIIAATLNSGGNDGGFRTEPGEHLVYRKATRPHSAEEAERWEQTEVSNTVNGWELRHGDGTELIAGPGQPVDSDLLPLGLDSHRYRCCGNGVVSDVSEWIGVRLARALA